MLDNGYDTDVCVGCPDVNQCGLLEASMLPLTLTLGVGRPLELQIRMALIIAEIVLSSTFPARNHVMF